MIFLSSPYSHEDEKVREENFVRVSKLAADLCSEGKVAVSPITYGHTLLKYKEMPSDWLFWKNFCLSILMKCEEMIVYKMPGWDKSKGVAEEIKFAEENGIKITYLEFE
jgi:hypothetical protein